MEGGEGEERLLETVKILPASVTRENTVCILDHTLDRHTLILLLQQTDYCTSYGTDMS